jgi:hypothetical protein
VTEQETTATGKDIGRVLHGPFCGRFVPGPEEIDEILAELGIERTAEHPDFDAEPEEDPEEGFELEGTEVDGQALIMGAMQGMGGKLKLPSGTPRRFPPFLKATQNWSERTRNQVRRIRRKAPGIVCATYANHGRTGEHWGIDIMVSPLHHMAQGPHKRLGDALTRWLVNNFVEMHINYVIWFNQINDGAGFFSNEPFINFPGTDPNLITRRHQDHVHVQIMNPSLGPGQ